LRGETDVSEGLSTAVRRGPLHAKPRLGLHEVLGYAAIAVGAILVPIGIFGGSSSVQADYLPGDLSHGATVTNGSPQQEAEAVLADKVTVPPGVPIIRVPHPGVSVPTADPSTTPPTANTPTTPKPTTANTPATTPNAPANNVRQPSGSAAQVARAIISAIDQQSGGRHRIRATADNVGMIVRWLANEGGLWANNPLNTSLYSSQYPHQFNGSQDTGIPIFPSMNVGVEATAKTLLENRAYARILSVLSSGTAPCRSFADAVISSPWAASHYGHDPARFCAAG